MPILQVLTLNPQHLHHQADVLSIIQLFHRFSIAWNVVDYPTVPHWLHLHVNSIFRIISSFLGAIVVTILSVFLSKWTCLTPKGDIFSLDADEVFSYIIDGKK